MRKSQGGTDFYLLQIKQGVAHTKDERHLPSTTHHYILATAHNIAGTGDITTNGRIAKIDNTTGAGDRAI